MRCRWCAKVMKNHNNQQKSEHLLCRACLYLGDFMEKYLCPSEEVTRGAIWSRSVR